MNVDEFMSIARAHPGRLVPVVRELLEDTLTPVVALAIVALIAGTLALVAAKVTEPDED